jgi:uncharacterized membrane protein
MTFSVNAVFLQKRSGITWILNFLRKNVLLY